MKNMKNARGAASGNCTTSISCGVWLRSGHTRMLPRARGFFPMFPTVEVIVTTVSPAPPLSGSARNPSPSTESVQPPCAAVIRQVAAAPS